MESKKDYKIKSSTRDLATLQKESQEFIRSINEFLDKSKQIQQSIQAQLVEHEAKLKANPPGPYTPLDQLPTTGAKVRAMMANPAPYVAELDSKYLKGFNAELEAGQMFLKFTAKSAASITDIRADIINLTEDLKEVHEVVKSLADKSQLNKTIEQ